MKIPTAITIPPAFKDWLLNHSKNYIVAQYPQAKNATFKDSTLYFDDSGIMYILVSYWTLKDYPNMGDSTEYRFDLKVSTGVILASDLVTEKEKTDILNVLNTRREVKEMGSPFDGDPMFQE